MGIILDNKYNDVCWGGVIGWTRERDYIKEYIKGKGKGETNE